MKKVILVSLLLLMLGAAVIYADSNSLVGRKVQSEAAITLNGAEIGSVFIIDGVSYAPVRVIAEASGLKAGYKKGEVMLTSDVSIETSSSASDPVDVDQLTKEKRRLEIEASTLQNYINDAENVYSAYTEALKVVDESLKDEYKNMIEKIKADKEGYQTELAEVESRIAEIDNLLK